VIPSLLLFRRLFLRPLRADLLRTILTAVSIALGVSVVVAIDLAGKAAAGSFESSVETLSGKASLLITQLGGINQALLGELAQLPYPFKFVPRIEDYATRNGMGTALPFIGLDLVGAAFSGGTLPADELPSLHNPILAGTALGWRYGDRVNLVINDQVQQFTVAGVLPETTQNLGENNAIIADIGLAQVATRKLGRLDSIAVITPSYGSLAEWEKLLRRHVPPAAAVEPTGSGTDQNRKMLAAFRWNLRVLSYVALVVGAFLIYNTIGVSVVRRRTEIGILRALGATRRMVLLNFLAEAMFLGTIGAGIGLLLGRILAVGAVRLIGNTVEMLYVSSRPAAVDFTLGSVLTGLILGMGTSLVAGLAPAMEAARVTPVEAMARARRDYLTRIRWKQHLVVALCSLGGAVTAALQPPVSGRPLFGYLSALLLVLATAVLIPGVISASSLLAGRVIRRDLGVEAILALKGIRGSLTRTGILVCALTTAVGMMVAVAIMVGSFRQTVVLWMEGQLKADLYLRPAGSSAADRHPTIDPSVADVIEQVPGVEAVDRFRVYPISYEGLPASLAGGETSKVRASTATYFLPGENRSRILSILPVGDNVIVSEPFANKHHVQAGELIRLPLAGKWREFRVLGIYYDYSTERGFVIMDRRTLLKYLPDPAVSNLAVYLRPKAEVAQVRKQIEQAIGPHAVMIFTNSKLRHDALSIFDRTFRITWALELIAIIVAVVGIAGALLALAIDRRREFGVLRFLGASKSQIRKIVIAEAGFIGLLANTLGAALGTALSLVLIYVINKQSFGWTIQYHWPASLLLFASTTVFLATVVAGFLPGQTAVRIDPIEAVHEE
jgi:putative ABC transport system permease protein